MDEILQLPGIVNVSIIQGDAFTLALNFGMDLTGYTFESHVSLTDETEVEITVDETDLLTGSIALKLSAANSATIEPDKHFWCFVWTPPGSPPQTRTILSGDFTVKGC